MERPGPGPSAPSAVDALMEKGLAGFAAGKLEAALNAFTEAAALAGSALTTASQKKKQPAPELDRGAAFNPFGAPEPAKLAATDPGAPTLDAAATLALKIVQGRAFGNISNIFFRQGDVSSAILFSEKALGVFTECGEKERAAVILFNLAVFSLAAGRAAAAQGFMEEVVRLTADPQRAEQAQRWLDKHFEGRSLGGGGGGAGDEVTAAAAALARPPAMRLPALPLGGGGLSPEEALLLAHARLGHPDELRQLIDRLGPAAVDCPGGLRPPLVEACRAPRCTMLHILTVQLLLHRRATVDAPDYLGATALVHAALSCSVCTEAGDLACGDGVLMLPSATLSAPSGGAGAAAAVVEEGGRGAGDSESGCAELTSPQPIPWDASGSGAATAPAAAGRPRAASDGTPRHLQLVMMLLNAGADPCVRSCAGVSALLLLAASPLGEAVAVFQSVVGRAARSVAAVTTAGDTSAVGSSSSSSCFSAVQPWWGPDARGRNVLHYCARAANVEGTRIVLASVPTGVARLLVSATDTSGATPVQVLQQRCSVMSGGAAVDAAAAGAGGGGGSSGGAGGAEAEAGEDGDGDDSSAHANATIRKSPSAAKARRHSSASPSGTAAGAATAASTAQTAAGVPGSSSVDVSRAGTPPCTSTNAPATDVVRLFPLLPPAAATGDSGSSGQRLGSGRHGGGSSGGAPLQQNVPPDARRREMHALFTSLIVGK